MGGAIAPPAPPLATLLSIIQYGVLYPWKYGSIISIPRFRPEATRNLYYTFATLSTPLQVVDREGKRNGTMHLIPYLNHYCNELPKKFTQHKNINHFINRQ